MGTFHLQRARELKKVEMSRAEISERVIEIAKMLIEDGSYKNAVGCLGRMKALSKVVTDGYWQEKMSKGEDYEYYFLVHKDYEVKDRVIS